MEPALPVSRPPGPPRADATSGLVGIPISTGDDPVMKAITMGPTGSPTTDGAPPVTARPDPATQAAPMTMGASIAIALLDPALAAHGETQSKPVSATADVTPPPPAPAGAPTATERCADERRLADERCEFATRARAQAGAAIDALRLAQRTYDAHEAAAVTASWGADPRAIHEAKDSAQGGFRAAVQAAESSDALEAAARDWLTQINRINTEAREATATAAREHAAAAAIGAQLERLGLEADAARISAENADEACLKARIVVAECDEQATTDEASAAPIPMTRDEPQRPRLDEDERLNLALEAGVTPRIFRLLRGDRQAMTSLVATLADDDAGARRRWQLLMTGLVEAIVADAIEASALEFPDDHFFWGSFTRVQCREVSFALSSLGFRFDGLGGWTDERLPSQRDLSLALGYAGLDPMRIRHWPTADETTVLYRDVTVAADEYLAGTAPDLTLAEMVTMLGRRADGLAEVWNQWGRIRPLLLDEG